MLCNPLQDRTNQLECTCVLKETLKLMMPMWLKLACRTIVWASSAGCNNSRKICRVWEMLSSGTGEREAREERERSFANGRLA